MYNFSALINDSLAADFEDKIAFSDNLKISNLELEDRLEGTDIADMDGARIEKIRNLLISHSKKIILLNSSKSVTELEYYKSLFRKAHMLGIEYINISIEKVSQDEAFQDCFKEVCRIGKAYEIGVLVENNSTTVLSDDKSITRFCKNVGDVYIGMVFNPLEYVRVKKHPFFHEFYNSKLKENIKFLRVNDGLFVNGDAVIPAQGNAEIKELASILLARGFKGYFSFTPYLMGMDKNSYVDMIDIFKRLLIQM